jgi:tripartite-type tricarboxylate transporter receptor subunit TctC
MKLLRRQVIRLAAGAALVPALFSLASAQSYPTRPVRIIVGFPAGGVTDITARVTGQWLSERLRQQFVVENRAGAATNIATEAVARASADGYTLLLATAANTINTTFYDKLNFDFASDFTPIASIVDTRHFQPRRSANSSRWLGPILANSAWRRQAAEAHPISLASCSR